MMRTRVLAGGLWAIALTWMAAFPDQERSQRLALSLAIAATTVAAIDRHAAQFREVVRLTLYAVSVDRTSRVSAQDPQADDGEARRGRARP